MLAEELSPYELAAETFPSISVVATRLGIDTRKRDLAKLGGRLLSLSFRDADELEQQGAEFLVRFKAVLGTVERACAGCKRTGTTSNPWPTLNRLAAYLGNFTPEGRARLSITKDRQLASIYAGLQVFASRAHELEGLLTVLEQTETIKVITPEDMGLDAAAEGKKDNVPGYPQHVNEALYSILDLHTSCGCPTQHLKFAKLRLDSTEEHEGTQIPFEVLFPAAPFHDRSSPNCEIWHETMLMVSRSGPLRKKKKQKTAWSKKPLTSMEGMELTLGEFCNHLKAKLGFCIRLNLIFESNETVLRTCSTIDKPIRNVKLVQSLSLTMVLNKIGHKMTTREKFHLAYILAKSVWQYYGSDWMRSPWTHDNIQFLEEQRSQGKTAVTSYNPYYHPNFDKAENEPTGEYCPDGILLHRYPNVLALAILLIEIIQGRPFGDHDYQPYGFLKIKEYYKFAWNLVVGAALDCNIIYKEVIKKCLDGKLFKEAPFDEDRPKDGIDLRRDIIYREIVLPLKHLLKLSGSSSGNDEPMLQPASDAEKLPDTSRESIDKRRDCRFNSRPNTGCTPTPRQSADNERTFLVYPSITMSMMGERQVDHLQTADPESYQYVPDAPVAELQPTRGFERPSSRDDFEIAIICAVRAEYDAVALLIDQFWDNEGNDYGRALEDQNTYRTGRIGKYNVVLALLPGMGKTNAANVAAGFRSSYRGIEIALIVGICGGVPYYGRGQEILLGDVVISGSVIQYDFGRRFSNKFKRKSTFGDNLGRANADVRGLLAALGTDDGSEILERRALYHLKDLQRKAQKKRHPEKYDYPGADKDRLFESTYRHRHQPAFGCDVCNHCVQETDDTCQSAMTDASCSELGCDENYLVLRKRLVEKMQSNKAIDDIQQPYVHFGTVASGDTVMRSSTERDRIAKEEKIIAFEMEGAGVWENLSCIIIKGVCDYCDSHKNKNWQDFASATAAATMKALLERYNRRDRSPRPWDRRISGR